MFSWATKQFEQITNTLAPPPEDAVGRFAYCCQRDDEAGALGLVPELPGAGVVVNASKGQVPLHVACQSSMLDLVRALLSQPGASLDLRDSAGNTCLHAACAGQKPAALDVVKVLVKEYQANVCVKNHQGETPYDVAQLNSIRQYLLPIQLQKETQEALDNGGVGLPPGIDLGGLRITNSTLAPPPMGGLVPPPPMSGGVPPPPRSGGGMPGAPPNAFSPPLAPPVSSAPPSLSPSGGFAAPMYPIPAPTGNASTPAPFLNPPPAFGMHQADRTRSAPASAGGSPRDPSGAGASNQEVPPAPASGGGRHEYALSGHSSAAIYKPQGRRVIQPDGFHSSSSDKRLQQKYGHEQAGLHVPRAVPPPPSSGNAAPSSGGYAGLSQMPAGPSAGVAAPGSAYSNPYAGGGRHLASSRRYVAVDPMTGQQVPSTATPPHSGSYYGSVTPPPPPPNPASFTVFMPGAAAAPSSVSPPAVAATPSPSAAPLPPPFAAPPGVEPTIPMSVSPPPAYQQGPSLPHSSNQTNPQQQCPDPSPSRAMLEPSSTHGGSSSPPGRQMFGSIRGASGESAERLFSVPGSDANSNASGAADATPIVASSPTKAGSVFSTPATAVASSSAATGSASSGMVTFPKPPVAVSTKFPLPPHMQRAPQQQQQEQGPQAGASETRTVVTASSHGPAAAEALAPSALAAPPASRPTAAALFTSTGAVVASPSSGNAASVFASTPSETAAVEPPAPITAGQTPKPPENDADEDEDLLDDVPLSPGGARRATFPAASAASPQAPSSPPTS